MWDRLNARSGGNLLAGGAGGATRMSFAVNRRSSERGHPGGEGRGVGSLPPSGRRRQQKKVVKECACIYIVV